jgi:hypothetical protein
VNISLVREHAEAIRPPRSLWVPFPLGRPLGAPNDPAFQGRVVRAALALFGRREGPVLEDYPEEAPAIAVAGSEEGDGAACPISFVPDMGNATLLQKVEGEISQLRAWHDLAVKKQQGRTATGVAGVSTEEAAAFVSAWAEGRPAPSFREDVLAIDSLRLACDELKMFYSEALVAQPGHHTVESTQDWFWGTSAGELLFSLHDAIADSTETYERHFADNNLVPRRIRNTIGKKRKEGKKA